MMARRLKKNSEVKTVIISVELEVTVHTVRRLISFEARWEERMERGDR
jgi:hypothetical protein